MTRARLLSRAAVLVALAGTPSMAAPQTGDDSGAAVLGGALGAYSGAGLGLVASLVP